MKSRELVLKDIEEITKSRAERIQELCLNDPLWRDLNAQLARLQWFLEDEADEVEEIPADNGELVEEA